MLQHIHSKTIVVSYWASPLRHHSTLHPLGPAILSTTPCNRFCYYPYFVDEGFEDRKCKLICYANKQDTKAFNPCLCDFSVCYYSSMLLLKIKSQLYIQLCPPIYNIFQKLSVNIVRLWTNRLQQKSKNAKQKLQTPGKRQGVAVATAYLYWCHSTGSLPPSWACPGESQLMFFSFLCSIFWWIPKSIFSTNRKLKTTVFNKEVIHESIPCNPEVHLLWLKICV